MAEGLNEHFHSIQDEGAQFSTKARILYVICKLFKKWCFSCSLFLNAVFVGLLLVKHGIHPNFNGTQLFTKNILTALSEFLIVEHFY